jgi:hypothetical protein
MLYNLSKMKNGLSRRTQFLQLIISLSQKAVKVRKKYYNPSHYLDDMKFHSKIYI